MRATRLLVLLVGALLWSEPGLGQDKEPGKGEAVPVDLDELDREAPVEEREEAVDLDAVGPDVRETEEAVDLDSIDGSTDASARSAAVSDEPMLPLSTDIPERQSNPWLALLALGVFLPVSAMFIPPVKVFSKKRKNKADQIRTQ
jgi:hypothetical protein